MMTVTDIILSAISDKWHFGDRTSHPFPRSLIVGHLFVSLQIPTQGVQGLKNKQINEKKKPPNQNPNCVTYSRNEFSCQP